MFEEIADPARTALLKAELAKRADLYVSIGQPAATANNQYVTTFTPGRSEHVVLAGIAGDQFMARDHHRIFFGHSDDLPQHRPTIGAPFEFTSPTTPVNVKRGSRP